MVLLHVVCLGEECAGGHLVRWRAMARLPLSEGSVLVAAAYFVGRQVVSAASQDRVALGLAD